MVIRKFSKYVNAKESLGFDIEEEYSIESGMDLLQFYLDILNGEKDKFIKFSKKDMDKLKKASDETNIMFYTDSDPNSPIVQRLYYVYLDWKKGHEVVFQSLTKKYADSAPKGKDVGDLPARLGRDEWLSKDRLSKISVILWGWAQQIGLAKNFNADDFGTKIVTDKLKTQFKGQLIKLEDEKNPFLVKMDVKKGLGKSGYNENKLGFEVEENPIEDGKQLIFLYNNKLDDPKTIDWVINHYENEGRDILKNSLEGWLFKVTHKVVIDHTMDILRRVDDAIGDIKSMMDWRWDNDEGLQRKKSKILTALTELLSILSSITWNDQMGAFHTEVNEELVGENPIVNYQSYLSSMGKSIGDKLFFLNKITPDVVVDFGCANGEMLKAIQSSNPNIKLIGFDLDENMLKKAQSNLKGNAFLTNDWNKIIEEVRKHNNVCLNLSSVIHEVYSYSDPQGIHKFWKEQVFIPEFKWVTVRDMMPELKTWNKHDKSFMDDVEKVMQKADPKYLKSFQEYWGPIDDSYQNLLHFLLKYKYIGNWEREVGEYYVPLSVERFKSKIPSGWSIKYEDRFMTPKFDQIKDDFDIYLKHTTHAKFIIEQ